MNYFYVNWEANFLSTNTLKKTVICYLNISSATLLFAGLEYCMPYLFHAIIFLCAFLPGILYHLEPLIFVRLLQLQGLLLGVPNSIGLSVKKIPTFMATCIFMFSMTSELHLIYSPISILRCLFKTLSFMGLETKLKKILIHLGNPHI